MYNVQNIKPMFKNTGTYFVQNMKPKLKDTQANKMYKI